MTSPVRIGINGFGRIGRVVARIIAGRQDMTLVAVNDLTADLANLVYLYNFDSTYGRAASPASVAGDGKMAVADQMVTVTNQSDPAAVPWRELGVDVLVDATGVADVIMAERALVEAGKLSKVVVTHAPSKGVDLHVIMGINEGAYDAAKHHVVASSICDANAIAHPLRCLDETFGIVQGMVTTLHPWLSYQNLLDGSVDSVASPGHTWGDYALGRSSVDTLIPKNTTAVKALIPIMPQLASRLHGFSYRIPTGIVTSADITVQLDRPVTEASLREALESLCDGSPYLHANKESLVGKDYAGQPYSAVIDLPWAQCTGQLAKVVVWYDNEWGYAARACDLAMLLGSP